MQHDGVPVKATGKYSRAGCMQISSGLLGRRATN